MTCKNQKKARKCMPSIFIFLLFSFFIASDALAGAYPVKFIVNDETKECNIYTYPPSHMSLFSHRPENGWREIGNLPENSKELCDLLGYNFTGQHPGIKTIYYKLTAWGYFVLTTTVIFFILSIKYFLLPAYYLLKNSKTPKTPTK